MAAPTVTTTVTELPESRVRLEVEVAPQELQRRVNETAVRLGRDLRMPGFRKGKVPPPVVVRQLGREAVLDETVRGQLGRWYLDAIGEASIHPVGDPDIDLGDLPEAGKPLTFSIEIGVRPTAQLGTYKGLDVPRREPAADEEAVQAELDQLREQGARLEHKEGPAAAGDFVVMDYKGFVANEPFEGGEGRDQLIELGSGRLIPGFEEQISGAAAGEERTIEVTFPDDYHATHLAGQPATFELSIKDVKAKQLPELDDDFGFGNRAANRVTRSLWRPSSSPKTISFQSLRCSMVPSARSVAWILARPPRTRSRPNASTSRSMCCIPFRTGKTVELAPMAGPIAAIAPSRS